MRNKRGPYKQRRKSKDPKVSDLEVAKKMIKIYQSAQDRNLEFDLSFETVKSLLLEKTCYYTSREFEGTGNFARSFDRIDSDKGYVEGNVVACTVDINSKKSNLSFEEIELLYNKLSDYQESNREDKTDQSTPESEEKTNPEVET